MRYIYALCSGLMLGAAFPPLPTWFGAFIGFIPIILAILTPTNDKYHNRLLYICFFVMHGISNWWVSSWQTESDPFLFVSGFALWLGHPFFFMLPFVGMRFLRKRFGDAVGLIALPFLWTAFEWLHSLGDLSYPWLSLGYTQAYNTVWVQIAEIAGVWGVGFVLVSINVLLASLLKEIIEKRSIHWRIFVSARLIAALALCVLPWYYGQIRLPEIAALESKAPHIVAGVIQPNINPWKKWQGSSFDQIAAHQKIQDSLNALQHLDLALWSETGVPYLGLTNSNPEGLEFLRPWINDSQTALLTGFSEAVIYKKQDAPYYAKPIPNDLSIMGNFYNAAILMEPRDMALPLKAPVHRKMRLTPFGENIPFGDIFPFLERWLQWGVGISTWSKGKVQKPLTIAVGTGDSLRLGCIICIESVYPGFVKNYAEADANLLAVITNDAWYNYTFGPEQHYRISAIRAIENRRAIVRCANSGVSGFISPNGMSYKELQPYIAAGLSCKVPLLTEKTLYVRWGDYLPMACTVVGALLLFVGYLRKKNIP